MFVFAYVNAQDIDTKDDYNKVKTMFFDIIDNNYSEDVLNKNIESFIDLLSGLK